MTTTPSPNEPSVDPERIEKFYTDLAKMQVELDPDPLERGPKRINQKTAECRRLLSITERLWTEASQDVHWYRRQHRKISADFELQVQELITNDPDVRAGRNITDRTAVAHVKLRKEREEINRLQFAIDDLEAVLLVIRTKRNDLKDIASRLRDQLKICQEEIALGGRWGISRPQRGKGLSLSKPDTAPVDLDPEVSDLLDDVLSQGDDEEEVSESGDSEAESAPAAAVVEEVSNVDEVLGAIETNSAPRKLPASEKTDADLDAALEGMEEHIPKPVKAKPANDPVLDDILSNFGEPME